MTVQTADAPAPLAPTEASDSLPVAPRPAPSLRDAAYVAIKHRITTCHFKPGEYLNEAFVAATLGLGRTPVHQAIDRLMVEGMLQVIPRKGVIVRPISLDEVLQIIEVRLLNESYAVRLAAERADRDEVAHLADVMARAQEWLAARNKEQLMLLDREFHGVVAQASRNRVFAETLARLHDRSLRFWMISLNAPGHLEQVQEEHREILAAIAAHDPDRAEAAMCAHIEAFRSNVARHI